MHYLVTAVSVQPHRLKNFFRRKNIVTDRSKNSISLDMSCNGGRLSEN